MFSWSKQTILLTGGTGSFGQAFTSYLLKKHPPKVLRIYSRDEYKQFMMQKKFTHKNLRFFIGDIRDQDRLKRAMQDVTLVVHAAAMKQILAAEYNPTEAIKTNILGAMNILNTGLDTGVERIFGLVTDKAVSPVNLYGATKLCMEKLLIQGNSYVGKGKTRISCVRYGNVAHSRGSVIPVFIEQQKNGILTITHKDMTRFWITLENAVKFVVDSISTMQGGEIFVPKMPSFKVLDLAHAVNPEARLKFVGMRAAEKLHEDLITIHESSNVREFKKHYVILPADNLWNYNHKKILGKSVSDNFSYNSGTNPNRLSVDALKRMINIHPQNV